MIYNIQENVKIVLSLLKQYNIRYIVISPGGTNIPLSYALQNDPFFHCYSVADERSAMYFAIGLYLQTGEIVATSCTSAQATRNYIPGLTEAFYKHAPILAITTAKLERYQYQDYMQAPDQCSLPKDSVKCSFDLPPVIDIHTRILCEHRAKEAILETIHRTPGPVQLNIRIADNLQSKFEESTLPILRSLKRYMAWEDWNDIELDDKKILIVVGEHRVFSEIQKNALDDFCECYDAVVYTNHLSNYHGKYSIQANLLVSCGGMQLLQPDVIITVGGQTGDYSVYGSLTSLGKDVEHWRVSEDGACVDTYNKLTKIFECPDYFFFRKMKKDIISKHTYFQKWNVLNQKMNFGIELPFSNLYVAQQLYKHIPQKSIMNFAILNSLRSWSYFPLHESIQGFGNVAAFGIDGCNSMLIGESMNTDNMCFIVTGDLAFFYDMNALGIRHIKNNLRILLINNGGGAEFKIMTRNWKVNMDVDKYISANGHNGNAEGWSENCGFLYLKVNSKNDLLSLKDVFLHDSEKPILMEVFVSEDNDKLAIETFLKANQLKNAKTMMRDSIKNIIGDKGVEVVKKMLK